MNPLPLLIVVSPPETGTELLGALLTGLGYTVYGYAGSRLPRTASPELEQMLFAAPQQLPANTCVVLPSLPLELIPNEVAVLWHQTGRPAILFQCRDPRDVVCAHVRTLTGDPVAGGFAQAARSSVHAAILGALPDRDARLSHVISNPTFPALEPFERASWLLRHPLVTTVRFERLVGRAGGGSDEERAAQIGEVLRSLGRGAEAGGAAAEVGRLAAEVDRQVAASSLLGRVGGWREELTAGHLAELDRRFHDVLREYGYAAA